MLRSSGHRRGQHLNELLADQAADRAADQIADQAIAAQRAAQRRAEDLADGHSGRKDVRVERDLGSGDLAVGAFCDVEFVVGMGVVRIKFSVFAASVVVDRFNPRRTIFGVVGKSVLEPGLQVSRVKISIDVTTIRCIGYFDPLAVLDARLFVGREFDNSLTVYNNEGTSDGGIHKGSGFTTDNRIYITAFEARRLVLAKKLLGKPGTVPGSSYPIIIVGGNSATQQQAA